MGASLKHYEQQEHARRFQHDRGIRGLHECVFCYCDTVCLLPLLVCLNWVVFLLLCFVLFFLGGGCGVPVDFRFVVNAFVLCWHVFVI